MLQDMTHLSTFATILSSPAGRQTLAEHKNPPQQHGTASSIVKKKV
jgi:hypothetical protein